MFFVLICSVLVLSTSLADILVRVLVGWSIGLFVCLLIGWVFERLLGWLFGW